MSNARYWTGVILGLVAGIVAAFFIWDDFLASLIITYLIVSVVTQLIWWRSMGIRIFLILFGVGFSVLGFDLNMLGSGNVILFIIGLLLFSVCGSFFLGCLSLGIFLLGMISIFTYPFMLFTLRGEVY